MRDLLGLVVETDAAWEQLRGATFRVTHYGAEIGENDAMARAGRPPTRRPPDG